MVTGEIENLRTKERGPIRFVRMASIYVEGHSIAAKMDSVTIHIRHNEVYRITYESPCIDGMYILMYSETYEKPNPVLNIRYDEIYFEEISPLKACELLHKDTLCMEQ